MDPIFVPAGIAIAALINSAFNGRNADRQREQSQTQHERQLQHHADLHASGLAFEQHKLDEQWRQTLQLEDRRRDQADHPLRNPRVLLDGVAPAALRVVLVPPEFNTLTNATQDGAWSRVQAQGLYASLARRLQAVEDAYPELEIHLMDPRALNPLGLQGSAAVGCLQADPVLGRLPTAFVDVARENEHSLAVGAAFWGAGLRAKHRLLAPVAAYDQAGEMLQQAGRRGGIELASEAMQLAAVVVQVAVHGAMDGLRVARGLEPLLPRLVRDGAFDLRHDALKALAQPVIDACLVQQAQQGRRPRLSGRLDL